LETTGTEPWYDPESMNPFDWIYCSSLYWSLLRRKAVALTARVEGPYLWAKLAKHLDADKNIILCHFSLVAINCCSVYNKAKVKSLFISNHLE
jgi:hypothetical protein